MIISFTGLEDGKAKATEVLVDKGFYPLSFRQPLIDACAYAFNIDKKYFNEDLCGADFIVNKIADQNVVFRLVNFLNSQGATISLGQGYELRDNLPDIFKTPNQILKTIEFNIRTHVSESFLCDLMEVRIGQHHNIVIDDVELAEELEVLQKYRTTNVLFYKKLDNVDLDTYDVYIEANGSYHDLEQEVLKLLR